MLKKKFYSHLMSQGKKNTCENLFLKSLKAVQKNTKKDHKSLIQLSIIDNTTVIQLKHVKKKRRRTTKEFPFILNKKNRITQSIKSILKISNEKKKEKFFHNLSNTILASSDYKNNILKTKETKHNEALAKKKYAFFRWFC